MAKSSDVRSEMSNISTLNHKLKHNHEYDNPCMKEHDMSLQCLSDNNNAHYACKNYFDNYKNCQYFWKQVIKDRKKKNIEPYLPHPQDRVKVKNEYLKIFSVK